MTNRSGKSAYRTKIIPAHVKPSWRKPRLYLGDAQHGSAQARKKIVKVYLKEIVPGNSKAFPNPSDRLPRKAQRQEQAVPGL
jgi:hypothetical protein